jgi:hypothetical protein
MCARRFLLFIFFLTLIVVGGAFAIYQWGTHVLIEQAVPQGHFEPVKAGSGPDYGKPDSWLARPGLPNDPSAWTPSGAAEDPPRGPAAIFYIHPTTYLDRDRWNAPLDAGGATAMRTNLFVESQASAFNEAGEVWAPRYRQAAYGAFLLKSEDAQKALDLAYGDVAAAFDEFVKVAGKRPIILAGHSQGALHLERLLRERIAGKPIAKQVVAAYVVGWPISTTSDLPALGLPACTTADQAGCVLSWMSFREPAHPDFIFDEWSKTKGYAGGERRREDVLCVNPISGTQDGAAMPEDNPGTLVPTPDLRSATVQSGVVGAHCRDGLLLLDGMVPPMGPYVLPGNNFHVYDYAVFWGAIRRDVERRLATWRP